MKGISTKGTRKGIVVKTLCIGVLVFVVFISFIIIITKIKFNKEKFYF